MVWKDHVVNWAAFWPLAGIFAGCNDIANEQANEKGPQTQMCDGEVKFKALFSADSVVSDHKNENIGRMRIWLEIQVCFYPEDFSTP